MEAMAAMDFSTLSRRELQALSKLNGVRANMSNVAMAEALQSLPSVAGIDEIGTTLCLPTPGKSAMKSVLRASAAVGEDQQQGSPLPRGRRVSVKSPEAIRMDVEGGDDEVKRDLIKEIVRTPGVALRSTSRRARATPAPIPTPAADTLRRSQRSAARKAAAPLEVEVSTTKRSTRKTARSKVMIDLDQDEEVVAAPEEEKVQEEELKEVASDEKCDDPKYEEVTKPLEEGNCKEVEPEQGQEVNSSVVPMGSTLPREGVMEEDAANPQEDAAVEVEQELFSSEKCTPLPAMGDSPILGVLSKAAPEPAIKNVEDASTEDAEGSGNWSPVMEITDEINRASEEKEVAALEAVKEDDFISTGDAAEAPTKAIPASVADYETREGDYISEEKKITAEKLPKADLAEDELDGESSEEDELDEEDLIVDADSDETIEESDSTDVCYDSDEEEEEVIKLSPKILEAEAKDDDFSSDLSAEFDNVNVEDSSEAKTESDDSHVAMLPSSAVNVVVKTLDDYAITEELEGSSEGDNVSEHVETIAKSLNKVTITEDKKEREKEEKQLIFGNEMSLRKLKTAYKKRLIAAKEGEKVITSAEGTRIALAELDDNAGVDC
ncbi:nucleolin [Brachypodium distachyon]|uniref:Uncharacterized protein n=1 Tax=Brachypodium distachyon TaxID=15368 RepID=I1ICW4_BRADI|nr:nucleolin [Brachypodium distachyon]KQK00884.1 hypothetical protein BRADI_3g52447v3 [Brachypodium distachyon]|eukprot:XP_003572850.3 nucleolin [Brachypodium distachyon]